MKVYVLYTPDLILIAAVCLSLLARVFYFDDFEGLSCRVMAQPGYQVCHVSHGTCYLLGSGRNRG